MADSSDNSAESIELKEATSRYCQTAVTAHNCSDQLNKQERQRPPKIRIITGHGDGPGKIMSPFSARPYTLSPNVQRARSPPPNRSDIQSILNVGEYGGARGLFSPIRENMGDLETSTVADDNHETNMTSPTPEALGELDEARSKPVKFFRLFAYSTTFDKISIGLAVLFSTAFGISIPVISILYGFVFDAFERRKNGILTEREFEERIVELVLLFLAVASAAFFAGFLSSFIWLWTGHRQYNALLTKYYQSILRQNISWFDATDGDKVGENAFAVGILSDAKTVYSAISQPMGFIIKSVAESISAAGIALYVDWRLALTCMVTVPVIAGLASVLKNKTSEKVREQQTIKTVTGARVTGVINEIKTVMAYNGQDEEIKNFNNLSIQRKQIVRSMLAWHAALVSSSNALSFASFALVYWYGGVLISSGETTGANTLTVFLLTKLAFGSLFQAFDGFTQLIEAMTVAQKLFYVIDREPPIDSQSQSGEVIEAPKGHIKFDNVTFSYPTRKDHTVLKDYSVDIEAGKVTAFVGESGNGKSTIVQLLSRFYDTNQGSIKFDGIEISELNIRWLRSQLAIVSQEPFLYEMTIRENLALADSTRIITDIEIDKACKTVQIYDFIESLPKGYDTPVADVGTNFSGGQRQRLVLARALLRNAQVLILDEATSYLDLEVEQEILNELPKQLEGKTVIVIAHRLATIEKADKICVVESGRVVEQGDHDSLMKQKGSYYKMQSVNVKSPKIFSPIRAINEFLNSALSPKSPGASFERRRSFDVKSSTSYKSRFSIELEEKKTDIVTIRKTLKYAQYNRVAFWMSLVFAGIDGLTVPAYAFVLTMTLSSYTNVDPGAIRQSSIMNAFFFLIVASVSGISLYFSRILGRTAAAEISDSLRKVTFESIIRRPVAWFEVPDHGAGQLTTKLSDDPSMIHRIILSTLPNVVECFTMAFVGLLISLVAGWQLTLSTLACFPILIVANQVSQNALLGFEKKLAKDYEQSEQFASVTIGSIRTVTAYGLQDYFTQKYASLIGSSLQKARYRAMLSSVSYAVGESIVFCCEALIFYIGARIFLAGILSLEQIFLVFTTIVFTAAGLSMISTIAPELSKIKLSCYNILEILSSSEPEIDVNVKEDAKVSEGAIEFRNVYFTYPSRPGVPILNGLNLKLDAHKTIAIIGTSGGGKTTMFQLLERFYRPSSGGVYIDGYNVRKMKLSELRTSIAYVTQSPALFNTTIAENIRYGSYTSSQSDVEDAAKKASIHEFIKTLPSEYETVVGDKGIQLSGGQRQRVCLARALLRNPKILLLDEFTSALDAESEAAVQASIEKLRCTCTILIIAHKLQTIQSADLIVVFKNGLVIEKGSHKELNAIRGGIYHGLVNKR